MKYKITEEHQKMSEDHSYLFKKIGIEEQESGDIEIVSKMISVYDVMEDEPITAKYEVVEPSEDIVAEVKTSRKRKNYPRPHIRAVMVPVEHVEALKIRANKEGISMRMLVKKVIEGYLND